MQSEILLTIKLQQQLFIDPKRIRLLKEIAQCGSINQAAKNAHISYKSAWDHLQAMNAISPKPILERNIGGKNGGGTTLTTYGKRLLQLYDLLEKTQEKAFSILHDDNIPIDNALSATAKFSLQTSARNQFIGTIKSLSPFDTKCLVGLKFPQLDTPIFAEITEKSAQKLNLKIGHDAMMLIKAPWIQLYKKLPTNELTPKNLVQGRVTEVTSKNQHQEVMIEVNSELLFCASIRSTETIHIGEQVWVHIVPEQVVLATLI